MISPPVNFLRTIDSISYLPVGKLSEKLEGSQRSVASVTPNGYFQDVFILPSSPDVFIHSALVRTGDPVLRLKDGDKIRVFQGGDSKCPMIQALGIIDNHIEYYGHARQQESTYPLDFSDLGWGFSD